jgi:hypothetical protein
MMSYNDRNRPATAIVGDGDKFPAARLMGFAQGHAETLQG